MSTTSSQTMSYPPSQYPQYPQSYPPSQYPQYPQSYPPSQYPQYPQSYPPSQYPRGYQYPQGSQYSQYTQGSQYPQGSQYSQYTQGTQYPQYPRSGVQTQPITVQTQPQPVIVGPQPQPVIVGPQPQPVIVGPQPQPVVVGPQPMTVQTQPVIVESQPVVVKPKIDIMLWIFLGLMLVILAVFAYMYFAKKWLFASYIPILSENMYYVNDLDDPSMYTPSATDVANFKTLLEKEQTARTANPEAWKEKIAYPATEAGYGTGSTDIVDKDTFDSTYLNI